jgi:hypothetical protein
MQQPLPHTRRVASFWVGLLAITVGALALRAWYAFTVPGLLGGDQNYYHQQANLIADGHWFVDPFLVTLEGRFVPSALHPPLWPLVLSVPSWFGASSIDAHRLVGCALGAGTVLVLGMVGRRLVDERTGLVIAGIASVYPNLWLPDGILESEALYGLLIALVLLLAYRWYDESRLSTAVVLGLVIGLSAITRGEGWLLMPLLAVPLLLGRRGIEPRRRILAVLASGVAAVLVVTPWLLYNALRFDAPVPISTNGNLTIAETNCKLAYSGPNVGFYSDLPQCQPTRHVGEDEAQWAERSREKGLGYARDHASELPRVMSFRVLREWGIYKPEQEVALASVLYGRDENISRLGFWLFVFIVPFAMGGAVLLRRRHRPLTPMVALLLVATLSALLVVPEVRYRVAAEIGLVILAGVLVSTFLAPSNWLNRRA